jgi:hypothetical protein
MTLCAVGVASERAHGRRDRDPGGARAEIKGQ